MSFNRISIACLSQGLQLTSSLAQCPLILEIYFRQNIELNAHNLELLPGQYITLFMEHITGNFLFRKFFLINVGVNG